MSQRSDWDVERVRSFDEYPPPPRRPVSYVVVAALAALLGFASGWLASALRDSDRNTATAEPSAQITSPSPRGASPSAARGVSPSASAAPATSAAAATTPAATSAVATSAAATSAPAAPATVAADTPTPSPSPTEPAGPVEVDLLAMGAVGDGKTDDTGAIRSALESLRTGDTLVVPAGKRFAHDDVIAVTVPGVRLTGAGAFVATNEERSAFAIEADDVTVDGGLTFTIDETTKRWHGSAQAKLVLRAHSGAVIRGVRIDGSASAGILVQGASDYLLEDVVVQGSQADGIHQTGGARNGIVRRATVRDTGDDGIAVVSYEKDGRPSENIKIESPRFYGNHWGRGFSVVGGKNITWTDIYAERSYAAGLYVGNEGKPWFTFPSTGIKVTGGKLVGSNTNADIDHGAVLIFAGRDDFTNEDIEISGLEIIDTRESASWDVGIVTSGNGKVAGTRINGIAVKGGPEKLFSQVGSGTKEYSTKGWTKDGKPVAPRNS